MIELFFANQGEEGSGWVTDVLIDELAASIDGLDVEQLKTDTDSEEITAEIEAVAQRGGVATGGGHPVVLRQDGQGRARPRSDEGLSAVKLRAALDAAERRVSDRALRVAVAAVAFAGLARCHVPDVRALPARMRSSARAAAGARRFRSPTTRRSSACPSPCSAASRTRPCSR